MLRSRTFSPTPKRGAGSHTGGRRERSNDVN
jgi:hypothetical protein